MQQVAIIPIDEWQALQQRLKKLEQQLTERVERLESGLSEYVGTSEAMRITGIGRDALYDARMREDIEYKYEGRKVLYLRTSLEAYNDSNRPRRLRRA